MPQRGSTANVWKEIFPYFSLGKDEPIRKQNEMIHGCKALLIVASFEKKEIPGHWQIVECKICHKKLVYWKVRESHFMTTQKIILCSKHSKQ